MVNYVFTFEFCGTLVLFMMETQTLTEIAGWILSVKMSERLEMPAVTEA